MGKQSREKRERLALRNLNQGGRDEVVAGKMEGEKERREFKTGLEKTCLFIITWGIYAVLFAPLIIMTQFFFPFVAPKTTFFRITVEIIFAAYLFLAFSNYRYRLRINALTIALIVFLAVFILASFLGINFSRSFWSTYERMTGIWTMLHLFVFFIVLSSCFKKREDWEKFLGVSVLVGVFLSLYVLQGSQISTRGGGTIGNTSFMAAYLLFDVFFAIILFLSNLFKKGGRTIFWQIFSGVSLLIILPVFFVSTARGAIAAFEAGIFLLILGYMLFSGKALLKRIALGLISILIIFGVFAALYQPDFLKNKAETLLQEMKPRFAVWQIGFKAWQERPLLGWGPENFNAAFSKHFNPCLFLGECGSEIWFDRVHNIVLDTLATTGIFGLLSYLAIFGTAIFGLLKIIPKISERRNIFIPLGFAVILLVYFAQNFLVFDMINTYLVFFLSLAFINFLILPRKEEDIKRKRLNPVFGAALILLTVFFLWAGNIKPLLAGRHIVAAISSQDINEGMDHFQKSLDSWMDKYETREHFSQKMSRTIYQSVSQEKQQEFYNAFELAVREMEKSVQENSLDFRPRLFLGKLYSNFYQITGFVEKLALSEKTLEEAIELSPANMQGYWYLAEVMLAQQKNEEAVKLLQKAIDLEPRWDKSHWYLAMAYRIMGEYQKSKEKVLDAGELGYDWKGNIQDLKRVIEIYSALRDDSGLVPLYLRAIELNPKDAQLWAFLAATYANLSQYDKAREAAQRVGEVNPDLKSQTEEFLKTLP